ncbi:3-dehydroquinate synthase [Xanthovirga aplysinae]|uniref:3-dehydroquinate synthase n=1 Tax=Xanthovirga aplysinae TaxID=2529853 RepID=UPI0012BBEFF5|nr:3-dehydroquinate synthase [Xanthovirga aplysinae]MTI32602.1 3-dehydroquinate synthase [Xanthovirga aplysinae]
MLPDYITISDDLSSDLKNFFQGKTFSKVGVLVDENTHASCYPLIQTALPTHTVFEIKSGEENKHLGTCQLIWEWMTNEQFDRHALLINLGGGVIGDMGGFCAATYKRGISFINIPTTLLSQVDASIGGKLGVDFHGFKNHIGVFHVPDQVIINTIFLKTLPQREIRSGFSEVIKHNLIADATQFNYIKHKSLEEFNWTEIVRHSVGIKHKIVTEDPTEKGFRKVLNFGHTIGHAIESFYLDQGENRLLHGEAIAIGMIAEAYLSKEKLNLKEEAVKEITKYIFKIFATYELSAKDYNSIASLALQDKKNIGGTINCVLLEEIGKAVYDVSITKQDIFNSLNFYQKIKAGE